MTKVTKGNMAKFTLLYSLGSASSSFWKFKFIIVRVRRTTQHAGALLTK